MGAALGAQWLCAEHPEAVRSDLVVNEGGGAAFELGGRRFYTLCVGEKGVNRFYLRARGRAGSRLGPGARRQRPAEARAGAHPASRAAAARADAGGHRLPRGPARRGARRRRASRSSSRRVERLRALSPPLAAYVAEPMLRVTLVPTRAARLQQGQRHPLARRGPGRLPGAAGRRRRRGARIASTELLGPLARRARGRVHRDGHRQQLAGRLAVCRRDRRLARRARPRGVAGADRDGRASATATGFARRSTRPPSTASARSASSACSRPRR